MTRLIDADAFIKEARNRIDMQDLYLPVHIKEMVLDEMPTVEAEPVRHGKWIDIFGDNIKYGTCSLCGDMSECVDTMNYCSNCGARMDAE